MKSTPFFKHMNYDAEMNENDAPHGVPGEVFNKTVTTRSGELFFFNGIYPRDNNDEIFGVGAVQMQVKQILANMDEVLTRHGITFEHIVKATLYLHKELDVDEGGGVLPQFLKAFKSPPPYTCIYVYGFPDQEALVCIDIIAAR
ncbi:MAG: RidA family protein [Ignavibacteriales bacterium]|nr:RidA family protein [Ignavibacteriales bacterium]